MADCGRCGAESVNLRAFRAWNGGTGKREREYICDTCHTEAEAYRGMTPAEIRTENARWEAIFARHVDPDYYKASPMMRSSFGAFAEWMEALCR